MTAVRQLHPSGDQPNTVIWCEVSGCQRGVDTAVYPDAQRADGSYNCGGHSKLDGVVSSEDIQLLEEIADFAKFAAEIRKHHTSRYGVEDREKYARWHQSTASLASRLKTLIR